MKTKDFEEVFEIVVDQSRSVLVNKAKEYATDGDRMHNFKIAAAIQGCSPKCALGGMMVKHTVSLYDMMNSNQRYSKEMWEEKIGDHINYLILLRALLEDTDEI